ncbi:MFS transporter [Sediminicoccus sp. BL-A-41-H5]|uniref:MFS transporter n=1 Tax=Sediminicoccus sp. BL-A-41-H5 TaxID=3421106 RepID=UPI003D665411
MSARSSPGFFSPVLLMNAALVLNVIGFANYAAVLPALMAGTGFSEAEAGVAGGAFFLAYAIGSPIFAALTDSRRPRQLYMLGGMLGIAGGLLFPFLDAGYPALVLSRALSGLGMAGIYMPGLRLLLETLPPEQQSRGSSVHVSTLTLGLSASFAVSGALQWALGWQAAFLGAAVAAGLAMLVVGMGMPSPRPARSEGALLARLGKVYRTRGVVLVLASVAGNSWEGMAFRTWWVALLGFAVLQPGNEGLTWLNLALATAFTGLLAMPLSTWVARRAEAGRRHRVIAIAAGLSVVIGMGLAVLLTAPFWMVFALSVLYACFIFSDAGSLPPALLARVSPAERGAALALLAASANLAACLAIIACGVVLQLLGGASSLIAWRITLGVMAAGSLVTACCMLALDRGAPEVRGQSS